MVNENDLDVVMSMHNLIEYSNNYDKTSGWSYYPKDNNSDPDDNITQSEACLNQDLQIMLIMWVMQM